MFNNSMAAQFCHLIYVAVDCFRTKPSSLWILQGSSYATAVVDCSLQFPSVTVENLPGTPGGRNGTQINMPGSTGYNTPLTCGFWTSSSSKPGLSVYRYTCVVYYKTVRAVASRRTLIALIDWLNLWLINACSLAKHLTPFFSTDGAVVLVPAGRVAWDEKTSILWLLWMRAWMVKYTDGHFAERDRLNDAGIDHKPTYDTMCVRPSDGEWWIFVSGIIINIYQTMLK